MFTNTPTAVPSQGRFEIGDNRYEYQVEQNEVTVAKLDARNWPSDVYAVECHNGTMSCSCPDFRYRRAKLGQHCKHIEKLIDIGLFVTGWTQAEIEEQEADAEWLYDQQRSYFAGEFAEDGSAEGEAFIDIDMDMMMMGSEPANTAVPW